MASTTNITDEVAERGVEHTEVPAEEPGVLANLGINGQLFAIQLLNFAVVVAILWFLIFKPLTKMMDERKKLIDEGLDNADKAKENLAKADEKSASVIQKANNEANDIVAQSKDQADKNANDIIEKAREEVVKVVGQGKVAIEAEREKMLDEVKSDVVDMVIQTSEKVLGESADVKVDEKWVKDQLAK